MGESMPYEENKLYFCVKRHFAKVKTAFCHTKVPFLRYKGAEFLIC